MENSTFLMISGAIALIFVTYVEFRVYKIYRDSRVVLLGKIDKAEKELQEDILQVDRAELNKTKSGRELLRLLSDSKKFDSSRHKNRNVTNAAVQAQQPIYVSSVVKWAFWGFFGVVLMAFLLGANIKEATWLNTDISVAEAQQFELEASHQQATYELRERLALAQTEAEIQSIQREQRLLDAQYQHDMQVLALDLERREIVFRMWMNMLNLIGGTISIAILLGTILWVGSKAFANLGWGFTNSPSRRVTLARTSSDLWHLDEYRRERIKEARYNERAEREQELMREREELINLVGRMQSINDPSIRGRGKHSTPPLAE